MTNVQRTISTLPHVFKKVESDALFKLDHKVKKTNKHKTLVYCHLFSVSDGTMKKEVIFSINKHTFSCKTYCHPICQRT